MRSIRLSLVVYFLLLVALALGAMSVLVYQTTQEKLLAEEVARQDLLTKRYDDLIRNEHEKLDQTLAEQARTLASQTLYRPQSFRAVELYHAVSTLGAVVANSAPNGHVSGRSWLGWAIGGRFHYPQLPPTLQFNEDTLPRLTEEQVTHYFQIDTNWQVTRRSRSMGDRQFLFHPRLLAHDEFLALNYDDPELEPDHTVRRVTLKMPVSQYLIRRFAPKWPGTQPRTGPKREGTPSWPPGGGTTPPEERTSPYHVYFQYAAETTERDQAIAQLKLECARRADRIRDDSQATLASLRNRLLWISLLTFAGTVVGGFALVRRGLAPLHRLSDAVSQVSERDFRLPFNDPKLPRELTPIVERLNQALEMLKRAFGREKQAAADISHELRTPLAAMLTTTEVALRKPRSPDEYREVITDCRTTCQEMSRLVERLLALARLDAGVDRMRAHEVDAADLAEQCASLVRPLAEARGLSLRVQRNGPALVTTDADKLREVLTNLLHNAIEYNRPHGSVEVAVERRNGHLQVAVRDTGIGIAPDAQRHIFERFFRADPSRQADDMHAGLGLAIVKGYIDLMGGTITVDSVKGEGSTFRVQLPVRPNAANGS